ncbi:hypothetical protein BDY21DRAFT_363224 [Lineolata rhizophorae]|uniref:Uncharacterized protein n=1 Tax=Lineolata rhizophorae TaxID=578093 RepID=A0A6A6P2R8_9PEZI|nr:hypothetical protein BDY21DRAFT_363224 [Lineolata rhizophorae]
MSDFMLTITHSSHFRSASTKAKEHYSYFEFVSAKIQQYFGYFKLGLSGRISAYFARSAAGYECALDSMRAKGFPGPNTPWEELLTLLESCRYRIHLGTGAGSASITRQIVPTISGILQLLRYKGYPMVVKGKPYVEALFATDYNREVGSLGGGRGLTDDDEATRSMAVHRYLSHITYSTHFSKVLQYTRFLSKDVDKMVERTDYGFRAFFRKTAPNPTIPVYDSCTAVTKYIASGSPKLQLLCGTTNSKDYDGGTLAEGNPGPGPGGKFLYAEKHEVDNMVDFPQ